MYTVETTLNFQIKVDKLDKVDVLYDLGIITYYLMKTQKYKKFVLKSQEISEQFLKEFRFLDLGRNFCDTIQTSQFWRIAHREILVMLVLRIPLFQDMQLEIL